MANDDNTFSIVATSLTVALNIIGLKLLHGIRNINGAQKILLTNLSISDTLNATFALMGSFWIRKVLNDGQLQAYGALAAHCILVSCEALIIITIDRVIATAMPFRYRTIVTKRRLVVSIIIVWVATLTFTTILVNTVEIKRVHSFTFFISLPTELFIFTSYVYILLKVARSRKQPTTENSKNLIMTRQGLKMIFVSSCIALSFAVFVAIPDVVLYFTDKHQNILICMIQTYYVMNPIIYIYCYPSLRAQIIVKMRKVRQLFMQIRQVQDSPNAESPRINLDEKQGAQIKKTMR